MPANVQVARRGALRESTYSHDTADRKKSCEESKEEQKTQRMNPHQVAKPEPVPKLKRSDLDTVRKIGSGSYGTVFRVQFLNPEVEKRSIKDFNHHLSPF